MPKRKLWDPEAMKKAVEAVRTKEMGYKKAVKLFNVPRATLKDYVKNSDKSVESVVFGKMGRKPILPVELEEELVNYCLQMDKNYYGITASDLKRMAFQLAIRNNIPHQFSLTKKKAGNKWMKLFMDRHPGLSFRKPETIKNKTKKRRKKESSDDDMSEDDPILVSTDEEDSDDDDAECPVCHKNFSQDKKGEKWIQCTKCFQWMHVDCAENPVPSFVCAICLDN